MIIDNIQDIDIELINKEILTVASDDDYSVIIYFKDNTHFEISSDAPLCFELDETKQAKIIPIG